MNPNELIDEKKVYDESTVNELSQNYKATK